MKENRNCNKSISMKALAIFVKEPVAGKVKTRLTSVLTPAEAANLYTVFIEMIIKTATKLSDVDIFLAVSPDVSSPFFQSLKEKYSLFLIEQGEGNDLGCRLARVSGQLAADYSKVVIVGSDSPTLPLKYLKYSFDLLNMNDVVIGPATDGGYYLIGLTEFFPAIFSDIPWSTDEVYFSTLQALNNNGLLSASLPEWYDIDNPEDLLHLKNAKIPLVNKILTDHPLL